MALRNFLSGLIAMPVVRADDEEELVDPQTTLRVKFRNIIKNLGPKRDNRYT